jgi:predicted transcriptional regulator
MKSHEVLRDVFKESSPKLIAAELGVSLSMVYKWAESQDGEGSGATNPLDRIHAIIRVTEDERLVQWIAEKAGGFFIQNPEQKHPHPDYLIPATNSIVQEFADLLSVVAVAAADNYISQDESATIRRRWEDLKSVTECFVQCCEEGNFSKLKAKSEAIGRETT